MRLGGLNVERYLARERNIPSRYLRGLVSRARIEHVKAGVTPAVGSAVSYLSTGVVCFLSFASHARPILANSCLPDGRSTVVGHLNYFHKRLTDCLARDQGRLTIRYIHPYKVVK